MQIIRLRIIIKTMMNTVKYIRKNIFKVTQSDFADLVGVTQATVSRWEKDNETASPSLIDMRAIREAAQKRGIRWNDTYFFTALPPMRNSKKERAA